MMQIKQNLFDIIDRERFRLHNPDATLYENVLLKDQEINLWEDILQIYFTSRKDLTIDIGWYGEDFSRGFFRIVVIKNCDWDNPVYRKECKSISELKLYLQETMQLDVNII